MTGGEWVNTQKRTFTKWCNNHLAKKHKPLINDADEDFQTGITLMNLINALYDTSIPKHNKSPKMRPHMLDNVELALRMVAEAEIKTNFLGPMHLVDKDQKMILGMLWSIILDYAIKGISVDELTAKEGLLQWVRKKTAGYRDVDPPTVTNFHKDWKSGLPFCALIHRHFPTMIDYDSLDKANAAENLELAFNVAEKQLGIPRLLDVEDLMVDRPDERSVMTYVSEYFHRFASQALKEDAAKRVSNFVNFARNIDQQQTEYEGRAQALVDWYAQSSEKFSATPSASSSEEAAANFDAFRQFVVSEKPEKEGERLDIEALYAEIQTELAVNGRKPYSAPEELSPTAIDAAATKLAEAEKEYAAAVRGDKFKFITKAETSIAPELIAEFEESFDHFDSDKSGTLDKIELKAALSAMGIPCTDEAALLKEISGGDKVTKEQYVAYLSNLKSETDNADGVISSFKTLSDGSSSITGEQLSCHPLTADDVTFLLSKMSEVGDGVYDFDEYVKDTFTE